jgi:hypothetical protein
MDYEDIGYDPSDDEVEIEKDDDGFEVCARCRNGRNFCLMLER